MTKTYYDYVIREVSNYIKKKLKTEKLQTVFIQHRVNKITLSFHFNSICVEWEQLQLMLQ